MTNRNKILLKKYFPFAGLALLTLILMVFFKVNSEKGTKLFEEGKTLLADFYIQNLKPLFYESQITRDDVFNFAVNNQIPIDKSDNKSLKVAVDDSGEEFFQIIPTSTVDLETNYSGFKNMLLLSEKQNYSLDSIIDSYKDDLYSSVLVNEKNTYAVNSELHVLKKAIVYDLYNFASRIKPNLKLPSEFKTDQVKLDKFVTEFRRTNEGNFVVFAQDTIIETALAFDKLKLEENLTKHQSDKNNLKNQIDENRFELSIANYENRKQKVNSSKKSVVVRKDHPNKKVIVVNNQDVNLKIPSIDLSFINTITSNIDALQNMQIDIKTDSVKNMIKVFMDLKDKENNGLSFAIGLDEKELETVIKQSVSAVNWQSISDWEEFGLKIDSLANNVQFEIEDSSFHIKVKSKSKMQNKKNK